MIHGLLRGSAVATALATTIGLASTLTACASTTTANAGSASTGSGAVTSTPTTTTTASGTPSVAGSVNPGGPMTAIPTSSPQAQAAVLPKGAKYVVIEHESKSTDGRTLYLQIEARGGACGVYTVVVQESATQVHVGLAQMPVKTGVMCPMYMAAKNFPAKLAAPAGNREVIDLATGAPAGS